MTDDGSTRRQQDSAIRNADLNTLIELYNTHTTGAARTYSFVAEAGTGEHDRVTLRDSRSGTHKYTDRDKMRSEIILAIRAASDSAGRQT